MDNLRNKLIFKTLFMFVISFLLTANFTSPILAANPGIEQGWQPATVSFVVDASGSMPESDPNNMRIAGVKLVVEKLAYDKADKAGIIQYGEHAEVLSDITDNKSQLLKAADKIRSDEMYTDSSNGLKAGIDQLTDAYIGGKKILVLLTDGVDTGDGADHDYDDLIREALDKDIVIYCIGLGDGVNSSLLRHIAKVTNGIYIHANSADDLLKIFNQVHFMMNISISDDVEIALLANLSYKKCNAGDMCSNYTASQHVTNTQIEEIVTRTGLYTPEVYTDLYQRYLTKWRVEEDYSNPKTGFYAVRFKNTETDKEVLAYRGTDDLNLILKKGDVDDDLAIAVDKKVCKQQYDALYKTYDDIMKRPNIILTGHSLGGGIALMMSNITKRQAVTFNAAQTQSATYARLADYVAAEYTNPADVKQIDYSNDADSKIGMNETWLKNINAYYDYAGGQYNDRKLFNRFVRPHYIESYITLEPLADGSFQYQFADHNIVSPDSNTLTSKPEGGFIYSDYGANGYEGEIAIGGEGDDTYETSDYFGDLRTLGTGLQITENVVYGGNGNDTLRTYEGDDILAGGQGNDILEGGTGKDKYIYYKGQGSDEITDHSGSDELVLYGYSLNNSGLKTSLTDTHLIITDDSDTQIAKIDRRREKSSLNSFKISYGPNFQESKDFINATKELTVPKNTWIVKENEGTETVACPVDVEIYNPDNQLVLTLKDGMPQNYSETFGKFSVFDDGNNEFVKCMDFYDSGYTYKIIGKESGTMNVLTTVDVSDGQTQINECKEITVAPGTEFTGNTDFRNPILTGATSPAFTQKLITDIQDIQLSTDEINMAPGTSSAIQYSLVPENADISGLEIASDCPEVASVENNTIHANSDGIATIILSAGAGIEKYIKVTVGVGQVDNLESYDILSCSSHVQDYGWLNPVESGQVAGTTGENKQLEAIKIISNDYGLGLKYRAHVSEIGWQDYVEDEEIAGTEGQALSIEALQIELTGEDASKYDLYYRVHSQDYGWLDWAKAGDPAGTEGLAKHLEAVQLVILDKGTEAPGSTDRSFVSKDNPGIINYRTHVENIGWQNYVGDSDIAGTTGQSLRLEGIQIKLADKIDGGVRYRTHVEDYGWQDWANNNRIAGTTGEAKRLEAIQIELTGAAANTYDVYYRVHAQDIGWMNWAKNGEYAGTAGYARRLEAVQIKLVSKGKGTPGVNPPNDSDQAFFDKNN